MLWVLTWTQMLLWMNHQPSWHHRSFTELKHAALMLKEHRRPSKPLTSQNQNLIEHSGDAATARSTEVQLCSAHNPEDPSGGPTSTHQRGFSTQHEALMMWLISGRYKVSSALFTFTPLSFCFYLLSGVVSFSLLAGASWRSGRLAKSSCSASPIARDRTTIFPSLDTQTNKASQEHTGTAWRHDDEGHTGWDDKETTHKQAVTAPHPAHIHFVHKDRVGERCTPWSGTHISGLLCTSYPHLHFMKAHVINIIKHLTVNESFTAQISFSIFLFNTNIQNVKMLQVVSKEQQRKTNTWKTKITF